MSEPDSFDDVLARLQSGDGSAAFEVFNRFACRLIRLARNRLDTRLRQKVDPEDVVQSVFRSFFIRQADGQFDLDGWDGMWGLLVQITLHKCGHQLAAFHAQRRDVRREARPAVSSEDSYCQWEAIARDPTPQEVASLTETLEHLMAGLDPRQQSMVVLRLQGYTVAEIAQQAGCTERTVHRVLAEVRRWLNRQEEKTST